jgi:hypothetical protein
MKTVLNNHEFARQIVDDEYNSMTYEGALALFEWFEGYEEDTGKEIEFDLVAIRCDFSEYENLEEVQNDYEDIRSLNHLRDNTIVIEVEGTDRLIIQQF